MGRGGFGGCLLELMRTVSFDKKYYDKEAYKKARKVIESYESVKLSVQPPATP